MTLGLSLFIAVSLIYLVCSEWLPRLTIYLTILEEESLKPLEEGEPSSKDGESLSSEEGADGMQRVQQES